MRGVSKHLHGSTAPPRIPLGEMFVRDDQFAAPPEFGRQSVRFGCESAEKGQGDQVGVRV